MKLLLCDQELFVDDELEDEIKELAEKLADKQGNLMFLDSSELFCFWVSADKFLEELTSILRRKTRLEFTEEDFVALLADEEINETGFEALFDFACTEDANGVTAMFDKERLERKMSGQKTDSKRRIYNTNKRRWSHRVSGRAKFEDDSP